MGPIRSHRSIGEHRQAGSEPTPCGIGSPQPDPRIGVDRWIRSLVVSTLVLVSLLVPGSSHALVDGPGADESFPVTLTDDEGGRVTVSAPPERIISLTPATTEMLFAIGAGERVVATTDADDYPPEAVPLPDVGSFGSIDVERIIELGPDLVIAGGNGYTPPEGIERLRSLGYPVLVIYAPSVGAVFEDIELIGAAIGREEAATEVAEAMREGFATLGARVEGRPRPRVFYEIDASAQLYGPADESFLAEMIELAGGEPITSGSAMSFEIPLERLIEADPEVIVLGDAAYGMTPEAVAGRPGWGAMTAVRTGAIVPVEDVLVTRPGPRLVEGLRDLIEAIHPDALR